MVTMATPDLWLSQDRLVTVDRPRLIAFELRDGKYQTVADVTGSDEFRATSPFPVAIRPAVLTRTGRLTG